MQRRGWDENRYLDISWKSVFKDIVFSLPSRALLGDDQNILFQETELVIFALTPQIPPGWFIRDSVRAYGGAGSVHRRFSYLAP